LARAAGAEVLRGGDEPLPEGWKGKPWALVRATRDLHDDWIVFVDADVRVHPAALSRIHTRAIADGVAFLSGFGKLEMGSFWEKVIQPSVGGLIIAGNDLDAVNDPGKPEKIIANGQLILVRRDAYESVGGHAAVKDDILDDVGLAKAFVAKGHAIRILFLRELFSCRMYTNLRELWHGWTKNLYAGMGYRRDRVVFLVGFLLVEMLLPYALVPWGLASGNAEILAWGVGLVALIHAVRFYMDRVFGQEALYGLLQPLGATMLIGLLVDSSRRSRTGRVVWKGRTYAVTPPPAPPSTPDEPGAKAG
ncbi:MAG: glycosyltransferase, partial [Myxococcota bacterium]